MEVADPSAWTRSTVWELAVVGETLLREAEIPAINFETTFDEALYLTLHALGKPVDMDARVEPADSARVVELFEKRVVARTPSAYLTNEAPFGPNFFYVNSSVMVPRPMIYPFLARALEETVWSSERALDLCSGCGCIGITLALTRPGLTVDLADISADALGVATVNIDRFQLGDRVRCVESNLFSSIAEKYSLIVANPPYLPSVRYERYSAAEVRKEPRIAFEGGPDGLDLVTEIIKEASDHLAPGGTLMMEVGELGPHLLPKRFPKLPFRWLTKASGANAGVFTLTYP